MQRKALITGITGQDGSYLAELLIDKGYEVHGIVRRASSLNTQRIDHLYQDVHEADVRLFLHYGDLTDASQLARLVRQVAPDEIYNMGAQSHVQVSFQQPEYTGNVTGLGTTRLLEAIRETGIDTRFYQASSSELFGNAPPPQSEDTPFRPRSPYGIAKLYAHCMVENYREAYGMFAVSGILFNHEGERRGPTFVTRKISQAAARIAAGHQKKLYLGNLNATRDWGHSKDFVQAIYLMLQQDKPQDFCIGTGESHTVREFCDIAFAHVGLDWQDHVEVDPRYYRPTEVENLRADPSRAMNQLGWLPQVTFDQLVRGMVESDLLEINHALDPSGGVRPVAAS